jgi:alanine racemase
MAVVKANAYGHGLVPCSKTLLEAGASALGVACVEEGIELRRAGIEAPILVFGGLYSEQIQDFIRWKLQITASSVSKLQQINQVAKSLGATAQVHLKIDSGMERIGVHYYHADTLLRAALESTHCRIEGIYSHLARAEEQDPQLSLVQLERFMGACAPFVEALQRQAGGRKPLLHISNSAGCLRFPETHLDMVRPGLALYGVDAGQTCHGILPLRPVLSLHTRVVYFKVVKQGAGVSYGHRWQAPKDTRVVTVPIGYGDGFQRHLSNRGRALIREQSYPLVGSICMDQLMIDIGAGSAYNGDLVTLIGQMGSQKIDVLELAECAGTIPHDILTSLNLRVPRCYVG